MQLHQIRRITFEQFLEFLKVTRGHMFDGLTQIGANVTEGCFHRNTLIGLTGLGLDPEKSFGEPQFQDSNPRD
jgi:hypothetical protein